MQVQRAKALISLFLAASLLLLAVGAPDAGGDINNNHNKNPLNSVLSRFSKTDNNNNNDDKPKKEWLSIDPASLLTTLVEQGGLFLPHSIDHDLHILRRALHCQSSRLNVWTRQVELLNFTVGLPRMPPLLRVGRAFVHWDSYTNPVLSIEVGDVDVSVEFTNLLLTQTNWQELHAIGFPPPFSVQADDDNEKEEEDTKTKKKNDKKKDTDTPDDSDSWIRFGSIEASGNVTLRISSKPLKRNLGLISYDTQALKPLSAELKKQSRLRYLDTGRLGLTVSDLSNVLQQFFLQSAQQYVLAHWSELAAAAANAAKGNPQEAIASQWDRLVTQASEAIVDYAVEATEKYAQDVMEKDEAEDGPFTRWGTRLQNWFVTVNKTVDKLLE